MSDNSDKLNGADELHWRETYFILFPQQQRPELAEVARAIASANSRYELENPSADEQGFLQSLLVESSLDHAAVEISYEVGDSVLEQNLEWAQEFQSQIPPEQLQELMKADARLDVAHYERVRSGAAEQVAEPSPLFGDEFDEEDGMEMLDPTCLLTVVDALTKITKGLAFDPASGEFLD